VIVILTQALSELIGEPLTPSDLTALILTDLFTVEVEQSADMVAQEFAGLKLKALDPLGGLVAGRRFEINMAGSRDAPGHKATAGQLVCQRHAGQVADGKVGQWLRLLLYRRGQNLERQHPGCCVPAAKG
jgi:hypothetical protein